MLKEKKKWFSDQANYFYTDRYENLKKEKQREKQQKELSSKFVSQAESYSATSKSKQETASTLIKRQKQEIESDDKNAIQNSGSIQVEKNWSFESDFNLTWEERLEREKLSQEKSGPTSTSTASKNSEQTAVSKDNTNSSSTTGQHIFFPPWYH